MSDLYYKYRQSAYLALNDLDLQQRIDSTKIQLQDLTDELHRRIVLRKLQNIRMMLSSDTWQANCEAMDKDGKWVVAHDTNAVRWSLFGFCRRVGGENEDRPTAYGYLEYYSAKILGITELHRWEDRLTFDEISSFLDEAIKSLGELPRPNYQYVESEDM